MPDNDHFDFVVLGAGFGGSIMSMVLRRLGYSVLLLERGAHPRFVIGESSTPFANLLLERFAEKFNLPVLKQLSEWGSWQASHPEIGVGLKRGFSFYHHTAGQPLDFTDRSRQLLVAASPNDRVADTHWYRPEFDAFLLQEAQRLGVVYLDHCEVGSVLLDGNWTVRTNRGQFTAGFILDATGQNSLMAQLTRIERTHFSTMPRTRALYAHFRHVPRLVSVTPEMPYPPEDAAVHHLFDGGWMWVLRFNNGITSAGFALAEDAPADWKTLLGMYPSLCDQFRGASPSTPFYSIESLSFRRTRAVGERFALLPSAAAFVDPLLSTGFALTLLGIHRLAEAFAENPLPDSLADYEAQTLIEADATADLVSALYAKLKSFPEFIRLSMPYFAALSFTETSWRLRKEHLASGFLLTNDSTFTASRRAICAAARNGEYISRERVDRAIACFDLAGLTRHDRDNWYPVDWNDLVNARARVHATVDELNLLHQKLGL